MPDLSIGAAITWLAERAPDAVAVRDGTTTLTRAQLDRRSNAVARALTQDGVRRDDRVAIDLPSGAGFVVACVGVWKAGGTPAPLSPRLTADERRAVLHLLRPRLTLTRLAPGGDEAPVRDRWARSWKAAVSSGSTGAPKVVLAAAPARIDPQRAVAPYVPLDAVQLISAPLAHGAPFVYAMRGLTTGHRLVVMPDFDAGEWLRLVAAQRVTWGLLTPETMRRIWRHPARSAADVSSLERILHLGARCPDRLKRDWLDWLGPDRVDEVYAGTESAGVFHTTGREWLAHPGTVGRPVSGTGVRVVREDESEAEPGETGEVLMRRAEATYSYLGRTTPYRGGWHSLGDAGYLDADGYLHLVDRLADLVDVGGRRVAPADVEAALESHPGITSAVVVGGPTGLHAVVQTDLENAELADHAARTLPPLERPVTWARSGVALRDATGKVRRADHLPGAMRQPPGATTTGE